ncbi:MAG: OB-fold nucleic acid binding domain-containing protein, partial [Methyloceanibacter sp.]
PMTFLRAQVSAARIVSCAAVKAMKDGTRVSVGGVILVRQRPGTASGVVFMTIEDETGVANAVIWPTILERMRKVVMGARLVVIHGRVQRHEDIIHVVAERLEDKNHWLDRLSEDGEELEATLANADEVRRPDQGSWREGPHSVRRNTSRPSWHPRCHPRDARVIPKSPILPKSRDFH